MKLEKRRRPVPGAVVIFALLLSFGCGKGHEEDAAKDPAVQSGKEGDGGSATAQEPGEKPESKPRKAPVATLETTQGTIKIRFFPDKAPEHVKNFIAHAKSGYYNDTYFHRVLPGFMIQGGDPNTKDVDPGNDGNGGYSYRGPGTLLKAEFNDTKHVRGIVSMARTGAPDSAGSQFFIVVARAPHLDGEYTAFGRVIEGMDGVDKIVAQPGKILGPGAVNPTEHQYINNITIEE